MSNFRFTLREGDDNGCDRDLDLIVDRNGCGGGDNNSGPSNDFGDRDDVDNLGDLDDLAEEEEEGDEDVNDCDPLSNSLLGDSFVDLSGVRENEGDGDRENERDLTVSSEHEIGECVCAPRERKREGSVAILFSSSSSSSSSSSRSGESIPNIGVPGRSSTQEKEDDGDNGAIKSSTQTVRPKERIEDPRKTDS